MSDSDKATFPDFGKLVPGFDFLKNLTQQASASAPPAMPGMPGMAQLGGWVAPTLNVEELDKRITELKAVQFWLDQNASALKATIQALEVQKMTLVALQGMNVNMNEMAQAFTARMPGAAAAAPTPAPAPAPAPSPAAAAPAAAETEAAAPEADSAAKPAGSAGAVDPLQWWGALTQQFQHIASAAMKDAAARNPIDVAMRPAKTPAKRAVKSAVKAKAKPKARSSSKTKPKAKAQPVASPKAPVPARKAAPRSR
jgi:pyruvate/2-oxoglutarate dehydrogenase complex dihydrolipoamide acyltransferase (E2) component